MQERRESSRSAFVVALARAGHQHFDEPLVFVDPMALPILGSEAAKNLIASGAREQHHPQARAFRAFIVARSRYTEDQLAVAVGLGVRQYIILGAGLDTFAYRSPYGKDVRTFEVDHPATQEWKKELLAAVPGKELPTVAHVALDLEREDLATGLLASGFNPELPAFVSCLGVTPYLTADAFAKTIEFVGGLCSGSSLVFDYLVSREALDREQRQAFDLLAGAVAAGGEPFRLSFVPADLSTDLAKAGLRVSADLGGDDLERLYFAGRADALSPRGGLARVATATK